MENTPQASLGSFVKTWALPIVNAKISTTIALAFVLFTAGSIASLLPFLEREAVLYEAPLEFNYISKGKVLAASEALLSRGKPARASKIWDDNYPNKATDGDLQNGWIADAYPTQWIEIDLQSLQTVSKIRLLVNQFPAGNTTHKVYAGPAANPSAAIATLSGYTDINQWLEVNLNNPLSNVRYIKVETVESPSWVAWLEIEVYGPSEQLEQAPQPAAAGGSGGTSTIISACGEITQGGNYVLDRDLTATPGQSCLNIHDASNVNINCANHNITFDQSINPNNEASVKIARVNGFSLKSCNLKTLITQASDIGRTLFITNSSNGALTSNYFDQTYVHVNSSVKLEFIGNTFNSVFQSEYSQNITLKNNNLKTPVGRYASAGVIAINKDTGDVFENNILDGGWDGNLANTSDSADDGIVMTNSSNIVIEDNTILNNWDCGIENLGLIENAKISRNYIKNAGVCGIGGWHDNSWKNSQFLNNRIEDVPWMFNFYWTDAGTNGGYAYFINNTFENNVFVSQKQLVGRIYSSYFDFEHVLITPQFPNGTPPRFVAYNNKFIGNDFGSFVRAPAFYPLGLAVDGGNNICGQADNPAEYPLACGPTANPTTSQLTVPSRARAGAGQLIIFNNGTVYVIGPNSNSLYGFPDLETFDSWGYNFSEVRLATSDEQLMPQVGLAPIKQGNCASLLDQIAGNCGSVPPPALVPQPIPAPTPTSSPVNPPSANQPTCSSSTIGTNQFTGCVYSGINFNSVLGQSLTAPVLPLSSSGFVGGAATAINFDWGLDGPSATIKENFSARLSAKFNFEAGNYVFIAGSDDGVRVYLDGVKIIDIWQDRSYAENVSSLQTISQGLHTLIYEYYENSGFAKASLRWNKQSSNISSPVSPPPINTSASPTAEIKANGQGYLTVNVGDLINYTWNSSNADRAESFYTVWPEDGCNQGSGQGPFNWVANTTSGTTSGVVQSCQSGKTYIITYKAKQSATGKEAVAPAVIITVR